LDGIELWINNFSEPPVYWLNGLAGVGKSAIAQTIAERGFADGWLGASFFCSRDSEDRSDLRFIFPTLAVQLARKYSKFRSILVPLVRSDPGIIQESLYNQMDKLIVGPFKKSGIQTVIVLDALDECKDEEPASAILSVLGQFLSEIPKVKFFLTGRPEPRIQKGFNLPLLGKATNILVLHNVKPDLIKNDIQHFLKHSFLKVASNWSGMEGWPSTKQLEDLCKRAEGLFVYAVATVKFIDHKYHNPRKQLDRLLQLPESSAYEGKTTLRPNLTLDLLYLSILQEAFGADDPEDDPTIRSVLGAVVLSSNPLSPSTIAALLDIDGDLVSRLLSLVHSLLILQEDFNPVRPFHKSFPDFITNPIRCTNKRFYISPPSHHPELLVGCLKLMNQTLKMNICELPDTTINREIRNLGEVVEKYIIPPLQYACRSWHKHLTEDAISMPAITSVIHHFLEKKFLFWLEVLSLIGAVREALDALRMVAKSLEVC